MPRIKALNKLIVERFVKKEKIIWPAQMKIANDLIEQYPERDFWARLDLGFELNSLAWFLGDGKEELFSRYQIFKLELPKQTKYNIGNEKIGEDYNFERKTRSVRQWLKIW